MPNKKAAPKTQVGPRTSAKALKGTGPARKPYGRPVKAPKPRVPDTTLAQATAALTARSQDPGVHNPNAPVAILFALDGKLDQRMIGQNLPNNATPVGVVTQDGTIQVGYSGKAEVVDTQKAAFGSAGQVPDKHEGYLALWDTFCALGAQPLATTPQGWAASHWAVSLVMAFEHADVDELIASHRGNVQGSVADVMSNVTRSPAFDFAAWLITHTAEMTSAESYAVCADQIGNSPNWFRVLCLRLAQGDDQKALIKHMKAIPTE